MKSRLFILSLVCVAAFSCGKESTERSEDGMGQQICFSPLLTKGTVISDPGVLATQGGFSVWVYSHVDKWASNPAVKTPLLNGVAVTGSGSGNNVSWSYNDPVNWPLNEHASFFAYGPAGSAVVGGSTGEGVPILNFTVQNTVQNQRDLLISTPVYDQQGILYSYAKPVNILFNHVLSRIVFSGLLLNDDQSKEIKVKSITLKGLYNKGAAALSMPVSWDVDETSTGNYELTIARNNLNNVALSSISKNISSESGQLFLMPQTIARAQESEPTVDVVLSIDGSDYSYSRQLFSPDEWLPGKSYNYQIIIDGDEFEIILISGDLDLEDWLVNIVIQPVPLTVNTIRDHNRLISAMESLAFLSEYDGSPSVLPCKYFALYLKNDVNHDLTVNMADYTAAFDPGEQVIFDAEKLINTWYADGSSTKYKFEVEFDPDYWELRPSRQTPIPQEPLDPEDVDAVSSVTTITPDPYIRDKGSIVLERIEPMP